MKRNKRILKRKEQGITLIALVITIIVLLILAGVTISMLTGENGILSQAQRAKEETEKAAKEERNILDSYEDYMNGTTGGQWDEEKGVNSPQIVQGMTEVSFILPNGESKGEVVKKGEEGFDENNWYDYETSKWANTVTEDGSYWVWIPRYAYKIEYNNPSDKSQGGTISVKFLMGTTDQYYDDEGNIQTAKRAKSKEEVVDTTSDYYVHPAFTDESNIDYANGGWDKEVPGIWVAKFEAGFASGNNNAQVKASNVNYNQTIGWVSNIEAGTSNSDGGAVLAIRNWLDGEYAVKKGDNYEWKDGKETEIKYPTFQPITYSMNYISVDEAYNISRVLTDNGNIYGLSSSSTDSHLMKNSEWGAVAYLSWSQYGTNGIEPYINNINANSEDTKRQTDTPGKTGLVSVYAITGLTTGKTSADETKITADNLNSINSRIGNTATNSIYAWDQEEGQKASSTLNMYGVYDLSGGVWERTAGYINNGHDNLRKYGVSVTTGGYTSTKYITVYPHKSDENTNIDIAREENYELNNILGEAIKETSMGSIGSDNSWNKDYSSFPALHNPFSARGGSYWLDSSTGLFAFYSSSGRSTDTIGFRSVLVAL